MDIITRTILTYRCSLTKTTLSRLCKQSNYSTRTNFTWILNELRSSSERYKCFLSCHRHESTAVNEVIETNFKRNFIPEHKVLHTMLKNSIYYDKSIMPPIKAYATVTAEHIEELYATDWSSKSGQEIFNAIKKLTYCHLSGSRFEILFFNSILEAISKKLPELQDPQIKTIMQCLITLKDVIEETSTYRRFMIALDRECLKRFYGTNTQELLLIIDAFYQLQERKSNYLWRALRKLGSKYNKLNGKELVQMLFVLNLTTVGSHLNMFEIESRIGECMHELTADEIGIIARGFFLNKNPIRDKTLMSVMANKVTKSIHTMHNSTIGSFMKLARYSFNHLYCVPEFENLLKALRAEVPRLSLKTLTHVTHAYGGRRVYDKILTDSILERVRNEVKFARLKDIERIIYSTCTVTPYNNSYYTDVCHELANEVLSTYKTQRANEIRKFSPCLVRILSFLTLKNIYIPELLHLVFNPTFVQSTYKNNLKYLTNEYLILHCSVKIELPQYEGQLLSEKLYEYLTKKFSFSDDVHRKDNNLKFKSEIVFLCKQNLGINVCIDYILPHYAVRDIVFGLDEHNNSVNVEPILSAMPCASIKSVNSEELRQIKWRILYVLPSAQSVVGHDGFIGDVYRKFRQYSSIGYKPIPIDERTWDSFTEEEEKVNYLRKIIYEETNHDLLN